MQSIPEIDPELSVKPADFGGFPGPFDIIHKTFKRMAPSTYRRLKRSMTVPSMTTLEEEKTPWLNFSGLVVGRNSYFRTDTLTANQIEQIGGTEYRALVMLSWMVPAVRIFLESSLLPCKYLRTSLVLSQYFVGVQLIGFLVFGPWLSATNKYDGAFDAQHRLVSKAWCVCLLVSSGPTCYIFGQVFHFFSWVDLHRDWALPDRHVSWLHSEGLLRSFNFDIGT
jgi:hypothetical protein